MAESDQEEKCLLIVLKPDTQSRSVVSTLNAHGAVKDMRF